LLKTEVKRKLEVALKFGFTQDLPLKSKLRSNFRRWH